MFSLTTNDVYNRTNLNWSIEQKFDTKRFEEFSLLDNDEARFRFIHNFEISEGYNWHNFKKLVNLNEHILNKKDNTIALELKTKGNLEFQAKQWNSALKIYNQSYHATPTENVKDISIILANRSAVLYHMEMYDLAINDIELAMPNYRKELMFKINERKAKCLLAKNELRQALKQFQETVGCLDASGLPDNRRAQIEQDCQIQIQMLLNKLKKSNKKNKSDNLFKLNELKNENILHESVGFEYNEYEGRFAVAKEDIKVGEQILVQEPHCVGLKEQYRKTNCQHCFRKTIAPLPCPSCSNVIFCSKNCRDVALASYHKYECKILPLLSRLKICFNAFLAIRIFTQKNLDYFLNLKDELKSGIKFEDTLNLPSDDYRKVFNLVRHEDKRVVNEFIVSSSTANLLAYCLKLSGYFNSDIDEEFYYIGGLISRNLQFIQFNTHSIFELRESKQMTIGSGVYPTLALFNHSCDRSICRYFKGTTIVVHSIKTTKAGDVIGDTYGPISKEDLIEERNQFLMSNFRFICNCRACKENWPLSRDMNPYVHRFKCVGTKPCNNVLEVSLHFYSSNIKCNVCGQFTNVDKRLLALENTGNSYRIADRYLDDCEYNKAKYEYIKILTFMDKYVAQPTAYYCQLHQGIEYCFVQFGNK